MLGEKPLQFFHGGVDDVGIRPADPILCGCKHEFQHRAIWISVFPAGIAHVCIDAEQFAAAEEKMVDIRQFAVKPKVDVRATAPGILATQ